ncbi:MAG: glycosyltransferase, partial [Actinomycetes bacterium]
DERGRADAAHWHRDDDPDHLRLADAGAIGAGKDAVGNVIRALALLDEPERSRFRFVLAGSSEADVRASLGEDAAEVLAETASLLDFKGFLPRPEVRALLTTADYTVLLRPDEPYANAGFPTKFAESLALGIPVIANLTSDIGHYLHDGVEGYVCPDHTPRSMADTLRRILQEHRYPNTEMRAAAATTGRQAFSTRAYVQEMTRVLTPKAATSR